MAFLDQARQRRVEMERDLFVRYPRLLRSTYACQGLSFGPGWYSIVDKWFRSVNDLTTDEQAERIFVVRIKEKLGGLQIHFRVEEGDGDPRNDSRAQSLGGSLAFQADQLLALTVAAQNESWGTCYFCGEAGSLRRHGWIHVSCDACERKLHSPHALTANPRGIT